MKQLSIIFLLTLVSLICNAQEEPLAIEAIVHSVTRNEMKFEVKLYEHNELVQVVDPYKRKHKFVVSLERNKLYTLQITARGHYPKFISINTANIPEDHKEIMFDFDVYLFAEEHFENITDDVLDFPFALLYYNQKEGDFDYAERYTQKLSIEYRKLLLEASLRREYGL